MKVEANVEIDEKDLKTGIKSINKTLNYSFSFFKTKTDHSNFLFSLILPLIYITLFR
jgi:hypothetical protein